MKKAVLWIEDSLADGKDLILSQLKGSQSLVSFEQRHPTEIGPKLATDEGLPWDGYLVDYNLRANPGEGPVVPVSGTAMIDEIRKKDQNAPIFLVSSSITRSSPTSVGENADYFFAHTDFARNGGAAVDQAFAAYFDVQRPTLSREEKFEYLCEVTVVPDESVSQLMAAFPSHFHLSVLSDVLVESKSTHPARWLLTMQWLRYELFRSPGPLYDALYTASMIGLTKDALVELADQPAIARSAYVGVFRNLHSRHTHWWPAVIRSHFINWCFERGFNLPEREIARHVEEWLGAMPDQLADCHVCGEKFVNTVVVDRHDRDERHPAHMSCTTVDSSDTSKPGFELPRYSLDD